MTEYLSSLFFKLSTESAEITDSGRLFQVFITRTVNECFNITTVVVTFAHCNAGSMASKTDGEFEKRLLIEA